MRTRLLRKGNRPNLTVVLVTVTALFISAFENGEAAAVAQEEAAAADTTKSGYQDVPRFGGPTSVGDELKEDDEIKGTVFRFDGIQRGLAPYFEFKRRLNSNHGLAFAVDYITLYMPASASLGEDVAASGVLRFFGSWTLFGRGADNNGSIVYKVEHRHRLGADIAPSQLGFETGYVGLTASTYSDQGLRLSNLYWTQRTREGRLNYAVGWVDVGDWLNVYAIASPWKHFMNLEFQTGATIPIPNEGLGAAVGAALSDNVYVVVGFADSNSDPADPGEGFDTFFNDREYFKHFELGWISSYDRRYFDNVHFTVWHADEREEASVPDGWGWFLSATYLIQDKWLPFFGVGYAEDGGALLERSVRGGFGYYIVERSDLLGLGLSWGRPNEADFGPGDDQFVTEVFYRLQLSQNFAITPDLQYINSPALNPDEDSIWILGLRARLAL